MGPIFDRRGKPAIVDKKYKVGRQFKLHSNQIAVYRYASDNVELCQPASISMRNPPVRALDPRQSLLQVVLAKGFEEVHAWLEADREELCGPLRRWQPERQAYRYGYDQGLSFPKTSSATPDLCFQHLPSILPQSDLHQS